MSIKPIGSVFLGDAKRKRTLTSSTPPSSPPPTDDFGGIDEMLDYTADSSSGDEMTPAAPAPVPLPAPPPPPPPPITVVPVAHAAQEPPAPPIEPGVSLELRLRWLEALLHGAHGEKAGRRPDEKAGRSLARRAEELQARVGSAVEGSDGIKRFMSQYDRYAHLLTPSFALSGTLPEVVTPSAFEQLPAAEQEVYLAEMELDIRAADRDLREIELLEQKGVTGAGKLGDQERLQPRLQALISAHEEDLKLAASLEKRIGALIEGYASHVDALSELFVEWDDTITEAEQKTLKLERRQQERQRLGY